MYHWVCGPTQMCSFQPFIPALLFLTALWLVAEFRTKFGRTPPSFIFSKMETASPKSL